MCYKIVALDFFYLDSQYRRETPDPIPNSNCEPAYSQVVLFDTGEMVRVKR